MPYVQRDQSNKITGVFARPQPGNATEFVDDSDPEVVEFRRGTYWERRQAEMPSIVDQLNAIHDYINDQPGQKPQSFVDIQAQIAQAKANHPKP